MRRSDRDRGRCRKPCSGEGVRAELAGWTKRSSTTIVCRPAQPIINEIVEMARVVPDVEARPSYDVKVRYARAEIASWADER
jgi:hypothetical protein